MPSPLPRNGIGAKSVLTHQEVKNRIDELPGVYAVLSVGLLLLRDPLIRQRLREADYHQIGLPRPDGSQVTIPLDAAFREAERNPDAFNLTYLRMLAGMVVRRSRTT